MTLRERIEEIHKEHDACNTPCRFMVEAILALFTELESRVLADLPEKQGCYDKESDIGSTCRICDIAAGNNAARASVQKAFTEWKEGI